MKIILQPHTWVFPAVFISCSIWNPCQTAAAGQPHTKPTLITGLRTLVSHSIHVLRFVRKNTRTDWNVYTDSLLLCDLKHGNCTEHLPFNRIPLIHESIMFKKWYWMQISATYTNISASISKICDTCKIKSTYTKFNSVKKLLLMVIS